MFQTVLREFLRRVPDYTIVHEQVEPYAFASVNGGFAQLPIRYTPGAKVNDERILETL